MLSDEVEEFLMTEANRVSKASVLYIMRRFRRLEELLIQEELGRKAAEALLKGYRLAQEETTSKTDYVIQRGAKGFKSGTKTCTAERYRKGSATIPDR